MQIKQSWKTSRRQFLKAGAAGLGSVKLKAWKAPGTRAELPPQQVPIEWKGRWIWYPEGRTLSSTFVFFRKGFTLSELPSGKVRGWVSGNSRYMLHINGRFVQRGPAPCDPRHWDVDPVDLKPYLRKGKNVVASLVCSFGGGDGTYVPGTPIGLPATAGVLFQAEIPTSEGTVALVTDDTWQAHRARCWPAGNYQRWYLRALQEIFDARLYPYGWNSVGFDDSGWHRARIWQIPPGRPLLQELAPDAWEQDWQLVPRSIPLLQEQPVQPATLASAGRVAWRVPPEEYFECFPPEAFEEVPDWAVVVARPSTALFPLTVAAPGQRSIVLTFDFGREVCGHPFVRLRAPAGTVVEMLYAETQDPAKLLLRTCPEYGQWVRVTTREGETDFEAFDWDVLRYLQLAIRGSNDPVEILEAGLTERRYPYPHQPDLRTSDETVNRAFLGAVTTHVITCQDTMMDNITRERQQYAGDVDHAKLASYYGFGEYRQPARMIRTYAQGQDDEGWFMDCWPAWDRCQRLWQKSLHLTQWGPIIDHGLGFGISTALYYLFSGDKETIEQVYPRFLRFSDWLADNRGSDGLLPVEGWIRNSVWMDHRGWKRNADKKAAFNIYYVGFLREGLARLAEWLGDSRQASVACARAEETAERIRRHYWSEAHSLFVDNLPNASTDGEIRLHDRTLAMALLYGLFPKGQEKAALDILADLPTGSSGPIFRLQSPKAEIGFSFPANACWRLWALSHFGRAQAVIRDLRERWGAMRSLKENGTFSENWEPRPSESGDVWCQNGQIPLFVLYGDVLGVKPTAPAFREFDVRPQLGDLTWIEGTVHSPQGAVKLRCERAEPRLKLWLVVPPASIVALVFPEEVKVAGLPAGVSPSAGPVTGTRRWKLPLFAEARTWELTARPA